MKLGTSESLPKYAQAKNTVVEMIRKKELKPGDKLPSIKKLMGDNNLSITTIYRLLFELEKEGHIKRVRGHGIYIKELTGGVESIKLFIPFPLVKDLSKDLLWTKTIHAAQEQFSKDGFQLILASSQENGLQFLEKNENTAGIIFFVPDPIAPGIIKRLKELVAKKFPLVFLDHAIDKIKAPSVQPDHIKGFESATEYLLKLGCTHVIHVTHTESLSVTPIKEKAQGYASIVKKAGLKTFVENPSSFIEKISTYKTLSGKRGIVCHDDFMALELLAKLRKMNVRVPEDFCLIGYGNIAQTDELTTIDQFPEKVLKEAFKLLKQMQNGHAPEKTLVLIEPKLLIRKTT